MEFASRKRRRLGSASVCRRKKNSSLAEQLLPAYRILTWHERVSKDLHVCGPDSRDSSVFHQPSDKKPILSCRGTVIRMRALDDRLLSAISPTLASWNIRTAGDSPHIPTATKEPWDRLNLETPILPRTSNL
ncbi:hypothetical protein N7534_008593 [Penicillium rubens]|nr:hypothetical protein N7534_008593 [Penicillium rubens]